MLCPQVLGDSSPFCISKGLSPEVRPRWIFLESSFQGLVAQRNGPGLVTVMIFQGLVAERIGRDSAFGKFKLVESLERSALQRSGHRRKGGISEGETEGRED